MVSETGAFNLMEKWHCYENIGNNFKVMLFYHIYDGDTLVLN